MKKCGRPTPKVWVARTDPKNMYYIFVSVKSPYIYKVTGIKQLIYTIVVRGEFYGKST